MATKSMWQPKLMFFFCAILSSRIVYPFATILVPSMVVFFFQIFFLSFTINLLKQVAGTVAVFVFRTREKKWNFEHEQLPSCRGSLFKVILLQRLFLCVFFFCLNTLQPTIPATLLSSITAVLPAPTISSWLSVNIVNDKTHCDGCYCRFPYRRRNVTMAGNIFGLNFLSLSLFFSLSCIYP